MHLASDYIYPYKDAGGRPSHCRVRVYLPEDVLDAPMVVRSEVPNNPGGSITNSAETRVAGVILASELITPLVWIEHRPEETTEGQENFELVAFSSYAVVERAPYLGETRAWIGDATWKRLDRATVEVLVGGKVVGQAIQLTHQGFFPPQLPPLGTAESVRDDRRTRKVLFQGPHDLRRTFSLAGWSLPLKWLLR